MRLFHEDHTLLFGLQITHNKRQEFNLILQIRKRGWGSGVGEERGRGFLPVTQGLLLGRECQQLMSCKKSICPNTTHSCSVHRVQSSGWK